MKIHVHIFFLQSKPKGGKKAEKEKQFTRSSFTKVSVNSQLIRHNRSWLNSKIIEWSLTWYICTFVSRSHFLCWKALEPKAVSSINSLKGRLQRGGSPVVQDQREQSESETEMQEVPSEHQKQFVNCESDQTMAEITQRDGGASILANTQKLPGHGLGEQDLGLPPWAWVLDWVTSRGLGKFQPFCNSGILFLWSTVVSVFHKAELI